MPSTGTVDLLYRIVLSSFALPKAMLVPSAPEDEMIQVPHTALLARSPDGWYLCDTGLPASFRDPEVSLPVLPWSVPVMFGDGEPVLAALDAVGLGVDDLAGVIMSHLHLDHTGGLHLFRGGPPIHVQRAELDLALSDEATPALFYRPEDYRFDDLDWRPLDGDGPIVAGIDAISTPGHTAGHMSLRVRMAESGDVLYAYDAVPTQWNVDGDEVTPVGGPERISEQRIASHRRLLDLAASEGVPLVPGHCPRTWDPVGTPPRAMR